MGDRASHCCCGGCELWTATLPANADTSDPPEGFVYSAPTWKLIDTLPGTDVRLRFDPSKSNPSQLTLTQPNSGQILRFTLSPLNDPELEFQQQLTFERGTAEQLTPIILELESQFYRVPFLDLWISDGHLQLSSLSRMFTGEAIWDDGDFSSLEILENTTTGKSFDLSTFLRIDSDDDPKTKQWGTFSITVPIESDGSRWEVSFEVDTPESEATFIASRASTIAGTARFDCPKAPACSANSPHYGAAPFDVDLVLNGPVAVRQSILSKTVRGNLRSAGTHCVQ